jgi:hypothetical protein
MKPKRRPGKKQRRDHIPVYRHDQPALRRQRLKSGDQHRLASSAKGSETELV